MGNDLKYGLVLAGVVVVIFMGVVMMRSGTDSQRPETAETEPITTEPDMFVAPQPEPPYESEPQRALMEFSAGDDATEVDTDPARDASDPTVPGFDEVVLPEPVTTEEYVTEEGGGEETTYVIQRGDLLSSISKKFYGTTTKWRLIQKANSAKIPDANVLKVGTEIVIPDIETVRRRRPQPAERERAGSGRRHVVVKGDTLWALAVTYYGDGTQSKKIHAANKDKIPNKNSLMVGVELVIP